MVTTLQKDKVIIIQMTMSDYASGGIAGMLGE
jgi:hypothetical protein